jgi:hypothetical protein
MYLHSVSCVHLDLASGSLLLFMSATQERSEITRSNTAPFCVAPGHLDPAPGRERRGVRGEHYAMTRKMADRSILRSTFIVENGCGRKHLGVDLERYLVEKVQRGTLA